MPAAKDKNLLAQSLLFSLVISSISSLSTPSDAKDIGAYTRKSGGVTVKRNANGTVEVMDEETVYEPHTSPGFRGSKKRGGTVGSYVRKTAGSTVKRNADGTVDVIDTSSTTRKSSATAKKSSATESSASSSKNTAKTISKKK